MAADAAACTIPIALDALRQSAGPVLVGFSGGLDSSVLLHRLNQETTLAGRLRAIHVHHGLHPQADAWQRQCETICAAWSIPLTCIRVHVNRHSGNGLEAAARAARHAAFADAMDPDTILALAHHQDDQAETVLMRALRGSGVDGLAAMRGWRRFANGWLWRPLLNLPRAHLHAWAKVHDLNWIDDPGNADTRFERNYLRREIMPRLAARWPHAAARLAQAAELQAQAQELLVAEDSTALAACQTDTPDTLDVARLRHVPPARRARVLRRWLQTLQLPALPGHAIARIERNLLAPSVNGQAAFRWGAGNAVPREPAAGQPPPAPAGAAELRRWRNLLHAGIQRPPLPPEFSRQWNPRAPLHLPDRRQLVLTAQRPIAEDVLWRVHARHGGERITLPGRTHSHALKHLLQQHAIPPWQRAHLPLLSAADGELLAAGEQIISARLADWLHAHQATLALVEHRGFNLPNDNNG